VSRAPLCCACTCTDGVCLPPTPPHTQIDSVQRKDRKAHAESSWARVNAEALGVELPGEPGDEGLADLAHGAVSAAAAAAAGGKRGKKRRADAVGVVEAGLNADSQVGVFFGWGGGMLGVGWGGGGVKGEWWWRLD
jgi:hypothetical protein